MLASTYGRFGHVVGGWRAFREVVQRVRRGELPVVRPSIGLCGTGSTHEPFAGHTEEVEFLDRWEPPLLPARPGAGGALVIANSKHTRRMIQLNRLCGGGGSSRSTSRMCLSSTWSGGIVEG